MVILNGVCCTGTVNNDAVGGCFPLRSVPDRNSDANPDILRVECFHIQGIRAADAVVYLNAVITQKMSAPGSPEGREKRTGNREFSFVF